MSKYSNGPLLHTIVTNSQDSITKALEDIIGSIQLYGDDEFKEPVIELLARKQELDNTIESIKDLAGDM